YERDPGRGQAADEVRGGGGPDRDGGPPRRGTQRLRPHRTAGGQAMKLYSHYQSSSAWRVRVALHYKQIPFEYAAVNLAKGEQHSDAHRARSPMSKVPVLELDDGRLLTESLALL